MRSPHDKSAMVKFLRAREYCSPQPAYRKTIDTYGLRGAPNDLTTQSWRAPSFRLEKPPIAVPNRGKFRREDLIGRWKDR